MGRSPTCCLVGLTAPAAVLMERICSQQHLARGLQEMMFWEVLLRVIHMHALTFGCSTGFMYNIAMCLMTLHLGACS